MSDTPAVKLMKARRQVLEHIDMHSGGGRWGCRVPDLWIGEAEASVREGQTTTDHTGRRLSDKGRALLDALKEEGEDRDRLGQR